MSLFDQLEPEDGEVSPAAGPGLFDQLEAEDEGELEGASLEDYGRGALGGAATGTAGIIRGMGELDKRVRNNPLAVGPLAPYALAYSKFAQAAGLDASENIFDEQSGDVSQFGADVKAGMSPEAIEHIKRSQISGNPLAGEMPTVGDDWTMQGMALQGTDVLGQMAPNIAAGIATGGTGALASWTTQAAIGGVTGGGQAALEESQRIEQLPQEILAQVPLYQTLINQGHADEKARKIVAEQAASGAFEVVAPLSAILSSIPGMSFNKNFRQLLGNSRGGRAAKGGAMGAASEGAEEVGQLIGQRAGARLETGEEISAETLGEGAWGDAILGAKAGAITGAAGGAIGNPEEQEADRLKSALDKGRERQRRAGITPDETDLLEIDPASEWGDGLSLQTDEESDQEVSAINEREAGIRKIKAEDMRELQYETELDSNEGAQSGADSEGNPYDVVLDTAKPLTGDGEQTFTIEARDGNLYNVPNVTEEGQVLQTQEEVQSYYGNRDLSHPLTGERFSSVGDKSLARGVRKAERSVASALDAIENAEERAGKAEKPKQVKAANAALKKARASLASREAAAEKLRKKWLASARPEIDKANQARSGEPLSDAADMPRHSRLPGGPDFQDLDRPTGAGLALEELPSEDVAVSGDVPAVAEAAQREQDLLELDRLGLSEPDVSEVDTIPVLESVDPETARRLNEKARPAAAGVPTLDPVDALPEMAPDEIEEIEMSGKLGLPAGVAPRKRKRVVKPSGNAQAYVDTDAAPAPTPAPTPAPAPAPTPEAGIKALTPDQHKKERAAKAQAKINKAAAEARLKKKNAKPTGETTPEERSRKFVDVEKDQKRAAKEPRGGLSFDDDSPAQASQITAREDAPPSAPKPAKPKPAAKKKVAKKKVAKKKVAPATKDLDVDEAAASIARKLADKKAEKNPDSEPDAEPAPEPGLEKNESAGGKPKAPDTAKSYPGADWRADVAANARVAKTRHSVNPWRIVSADEKAITRPENIDHPDLGPTSINSPLSYRTKKEAVAALAALKQEFSPEPAIEPATEAAPETAPEPSPDLDAEAAIARQAYAKEQAQAQRDKDLIAEKVLSDSQARAEKAKARLADAKKRVAANKKKALKEKADLDAKADEEFAAYQKAREDAEKKKAGEAALTDEQETVDEVAAKDVDAEPDAGFLIEPEAIESLLGAAKREKVSVRNAIAAAAEHARNGDATAAAESLALARWTAKSPTLKRRINQAIKVGTGARANHHKPEFSIGEKPANNNGPKSKQGLVNQKIRSALKVDKDGVATVLDGGPYTVRVVEHHDDLPSSVKDQIPEGRGDYVRGVIDGDQIYIVANAHSSVHDAKVTIAHEVVGHYNLQDIMGDAWADLETTVQALVDSKNGRAVEIMEEVKSRYADENGNLPDSSTLISEFMAIAAERRVNEGRLAQAVRMVRESIRRFLHSTLGLNLAPNMTDLDRLITAAGQHVPLSAANGNAQFSIEADPTSETGRYTNADGRTYTKGQESVFDKVLKDRDQPSWRERQEWLADRPRDRLIQSVADKHHAIKTQVGVKEHADIQQSMDMAMNPSRAVVEHGQVTMLDGAPMIDFEKDSLKDIHEFVGNDMEDFHYWRMGLRARKLAEEGKEHFLNKGEIDALNSLSQGVIEKGPHKGRQRAEVWAEANQKMARWNKSLVQFAIDSGVINADEAATWEHDSYVPFFRVLDEKAGQPSGPRTLGNNSGSVRQTAFQKLRGSELKLGHPLENIVKNAHHLMAAAMKNEAARTMLAQAESAGVVERLNPKKKKDIPKNSMWVREDGKKVHYKVDDPLLFAAIEAMNPMRDLGMGFRALRVVKRAFTRLVMSNPVTVGVNVFRDLMMVSAVGGSLSIPRTVWDGIKVMSDSKQRAQLHALGALMSHDYFNEADINSSSRLVQAEMDSLGVNNGGVLSKYARMIRPIERWETAMTTLENIPRAGMVQHRLRQGDSFKESARASRDLYNPTMSGSSKTVQMILQTVPFANAIIQGNYKVGRAATDKSTRKQFAAVVGVIGLASAYLALQNNEQEEEEWYRELTQYERNTYWHYNAGGKIIAIPKPHDIGIVSNIAEASVDMILRDDVNGKDVASRLGEALYDQLAFWGLNPVFNTAIGVAFNRDRFFDSPIESLAMQQNNTKPNRSRASTSPASKELSKAMAAVLPDSAVLSPVMIDFVARSMAGWVGQQALELGGMLFDEGYGEKPDRNLDKQPFIGRFVRDVEEPNAFIPQIDSIYEWKAIAKAAIGDAKLMDETGRAADLADLKRDRLGQIYLPNGERVDLVLGKFTKRLADYRKAMSVIYMDPKLSGQTKRLRMNELLRQRNAEARRIEHYFRPFLKK